VSATGAAPTLGFVGMRLHETGAVWVGAVTSGAVHRVATRDDFWADPHGWIEEARRSPRPSVSPAEHTRVPIVPPSARVMCVGLIQET